MKYNRPDRNEYWIPPQKSSLPQAVKSRPDLDTATSVELGIMMQEISGTKRATEFMKQRQVPIDVAMRVLLRPSERRKPHQNTKKKT